MAMLVDSNVLLDLATQDTVWQPWSETTLSHWASRSVLAINPIVYAEVSIGYPTLEALEAALPRRFFVREALPYEAGFLTGKAFLSYRRRGGTRPTPLPDIYIGAHAAIRGYRLMTRDPKPYATYFPSVDLVAPR